MKTARGTFLLLVAVLAFWELLSVTAQTTGRRPIKKPGECPEERYHAPDRFYDSFCQTDGDCPKDKKCCLDNGDTFCKPPAKERPGKCPGYVKTAFTRTEDFCTSDSECAKNLKCCFSKGGRTCVPSLQEKKDFCPLNAIRCFRAARNTCGNDDTCPGDEKCCSSMCGSECLLPQKV